MMMFVLQLLALVALPAVLIAVLWRSHAPDISRWLIKVLGMGAFLAYLLVLGRWDVLSVYLRYVVALAFLGAVLVSARRLKGARWIARDEQGGVSWRAFVAPLAMLAFFSALFVVAVRGYFFSDSAVTLELPLRDGWFYVGQGGNSTILKYHHPIAAQQYALDIVALNAFGARARGALPADLSKYAIFGAPVYSPCAGRVVAAVDNFPDRIPPQTDRDHVAGNHVVISCKDARILLAHLREGSVEVNQGDAVDPQTVVGAVGNSGNTSEPHLHIHAVAEGSGDVLKGTGVPLLFDHRFLVRNATFGTR